MNKNIPYVRIERNKKKHQFYFSDSPIHPDKLIPMLEKLNPSIIFIRVFKNEKKYWEAYYIIKKPEQIEKFIWKSFHYKL